MRKVLGAWQNGDDLMNTHGVSGQILSKYNSSYYEPQECQLMMAKNFNQMFGWGFKDSDFPDLIPEPILPRLRREFLVLAIYFPAKGKLDGARRTFLELRKTLMYQMNVLGASSVQTIIERFRHRHDYDELRLLSGIEHKPGLRWVFIRVDDDRDMEKCSLAGPEILSALLFLPRWGRSMDGRNIPFCFLPGYQINKSENGGRAYRDWWSGGTRKIINPKWDNDHDRSLKWAKPRYRDVRLK